MPGYDYSGPIVRDVSSSQAVAARAKAYPGFPVVLAASAVAVTAPNDILPNTLATIVLPGGAMGPNGFIEVESLWSMTNNANVKNLRFMFGGTNYMGVGLPNASSIQHHIRITNRGSEAEQVGFTPNQHGWGPSGNVNLTSTTDTSVDLDILFRVEKTVATDVVTLESYVIKLVYLP